MADWSTFFASRSRPNTANTFYGALVMLIFGISTIPALLGLGLFTGIFTRSSVRKVMINLASIIVVIYGVYTIYRGYDFIRNPDKSLINCCESEDVDENRDRDGDKESSNRWRVP